LKGIIMKNLVTVLGLLTVLTFLLIFGGCGDDDIIPPVNTKSDLTRTGKFITFTSNLDGDYDIYLAQVDENGNLVTTGLVYNSNPYNLTNSFNTNTDKQSNWSPDGRILVFSSRSANIEEVYAYFFKADGGIDSAISPNPKLLFNSGGNWDQNPSYSPDGLYVIWDRRYDNDNQPGLDTADSRDLYFGATSGTGNNYTVQNIRAIKTTQQDEYNPKWSPRIAVRKVAYEFQSSATSTDHDVYVIDPFDTTNNINFYNPNNSGYPAWSPACDNIIFESDKSSGDFWKIVSLCYPAGSCQPVDVISEANVHLRYPTRLPNANLLAYIRFAPSNGLGNIYIIPSGGGVPFKLLLSQPQFDNANNLWPAW